MEQKKDNVGVNVEHEYTGDLMLLTLHDGEDKQTLKFDFDSALRLQQKIMAVTRIMRGNKVLVAYEAVGRAADTEKKARQNR